MMKKLALLLSLCVMVLAVSTTVFAGEIEINQVGEVITITGSQFESGEQIGIVSLKPGVDSLNNIDVDKPIESIDYIDQVEVDENGGFTLTFTSSGEQGVYRVYYTGNTETPGGTYEISIDGGNGAISGKITSAGNVNQILITVKKGDEEVTTAHPDENGNFSIAGLAAGTYSVEFVKKGHLKLTINGVEVTEGDKSLGNKALIPGDINGDGDINIMDLQAVLDIYGKTIASEDYNENTDINDDTDINIIDLQNVLDNYGQTTANYN